MEFKPYDGEVVPDTATFARPKLEPYSGPVISDQPRGVTDDLADVAKTAGSALVSGTGSALRGFGEASKMVAAPIAAAVGLRAGNFLNTPADWLQAKGAGLAESVSPEFSQATADTGVEGNILKGESLHFRGDPSLRGAAGQAAQILGGAAPFIGAAVLTRGASVPTQLATMGAVGAATGGGAALEHEGERIRSMPFDELQKVPAYTAEIAAGASPGAARETVAKAAGEGSFVPGSIAGGVGGMVLGLPFARPVQSALAKVVGEGLLPRALAGGMTDAALNAGVGVGQNAAEIAAANRATGETRDIGEGSGGAAAAGAAFGGLAGGFGSLFHGRAAPVKPPANVPHPEATPGSMSEAANVAAVTQEALHAKAEPGGPNSYEALRRDADELLASQNDILNKNGNPFRNVEAANKAAAKNPGYDVVSVGKDQWVLRNPNAAKVTPASEPGAAQPKEVIREGEKVQGTGEWTQGAAQTEPAPVRGAEGLTTGEGVPANEPPASPSITKETTNAIDQVRENPRQAGVQGRPSEAGQDVGRQDLQQPAQAGAGAGERAGAQPEVGARPVEPITPEAHAAAIENALTTHQVMGEPIDGMRNLRGLKKDVESGNVSGPMLFMDLDRFKNVNDRLGQEGGDQVLHRIMSVAAEHLPGKVYGIGGDEIVHATNAADPVELEKAGKALQTAIGSLKIKVTLPDGRVEQVTNLGLSYGIGKDVPEANAAAKANKAAKLGVNPRSGHAGDDVRGLGGNAAAGVEAGSGERRAESRPVQAAAPEARVTAPAPAKPADPEITGLANKVFEKQVAAVRKKGETDAAFEKRQAELAAQEKADRAKTPEQFAALESAAQDERVATEIAKGKAAGVEEPPPTAMQAAFAKAKGEPLYHAGEQPKAERPPEHHAAIEKYAAARPGALETVVVKSAADLPALPDGTPHRADAAGYADLDNGKVYLVSDNIRDARHAQSIIAHEQVGHFGVEAITGEKTWAAIETQLADWRTHPERLAPAIRDAVASASERYRGANDALFAREALAVMAERGVDASVLDRVVAAMRRFARETLGLDIQFTQAEARALVARAARHVKRADGSKLSMAGVDRVGPLYSVADVRQAAAAIDAVTAERQREIGRGIGRATMAEQARNVAKADSAVDDFRTHLDKRVGELRKQGLEGQGLALAAYKDIIAFQRGGKEAVTDPVSRQAIDLGDRLLDRQYDDLRKQDPAGKYLPNLRENYWHQLWKDPVERVASVFETIAGKRPLAGDKAFTRQRFYEDYEEGIKAGLEPASLNPMDAFMARYQSGEKLIASLRWRNELEQRGWLRKDDPDARIPQGYSRVNDPTFRGVLAPDLVARDLNNHLAQGLGQFQAWRSFRWFQNMMLSARLGLSAFHAGMTTLDSAASNLDLGWRYLAKGDLGSSMKSFADAALAIPHTLQAIAGKGKGASLLKQYLGEEASDPQMQAIFHFLDQGGARARMSSTEYNNDFTSAIRAYRQGDTAAATRKALPALIESTTRLIAHRLVPAQKMMARVMLAKFELERLAPKLGEEASDYAGTVDALNPDVMRQIAAKVNADVDDRLGQFTYDNLFWHRTVRDALHTSVQSVGWNAGTLRLIFGSLSDVKGIAKPEEYLGPLGKAGTVTNERMARMSNRLSYLITLNATVAIMGAMTQQLLTGKGPEEPKDYFFPKTGRTNPDGSPERVSFPSYVKDEWQFSRHPVETLKHKLHPTLSMMSEMLSNKDFYGNQIFNPEDPIPREVQQFLTYMAKSFLPYSVQGAAKNAKAGEGLAAKVAPFVGITPAPANVSRTAFQDYVAERYFDTLPQGARTAEMAERSDRFKEELAKVKAGEVPDLNGLSPRQVKNLRTEAHQDVPAIRFARLPLNQKIKAWDMASEQERKQYKLGPALLRSVRSALPNIPVEDRPEMMERVRRVRETLATQ
jgi:diguanylate cyclase (GGDEF)-like protein